MSILNRNVFKLSVAALAVFAYNNVLADDSSAGAGAGAGAAAAGAAGSSAVSGFDANAARSFAESEIYNLNANYNSFETNRDYENFIQSRSKLLKRNANDELRDVDVNAQPVDENSIKIDNFVIDSENGFNPLLTAKLQSIANEYKGQMFNARKIAALKNNLNNILIREGYSTSIIYISDNAYDKTTKTIKFNLKWGLVNTIRVADNQEDKDFYKNSLMLKTLPSFRGDVLRLSTIDQVVDNLTTTNKDVRIDVAATPNRKGYSDVIVNAYRTKKPLFTLGLNNANDRGQLTGEFTVQAGDVIGSNDSWTFRYQKRLISRMDERHTDILSLRLDQPLGFFNLSINNTLVSFKNTVQSENNKAYVVHAPSFKTDWKLSYVAYRDQTKVVNAFAGVSYKNGETDLKFAENKNLISNTKSKISDWRLGANYLNNAFFGGRLYVEGYYTQGWGLFNSDKTADYVAIQNNGKQSYEFNDYAKNLNLYVNYNRNLFIKQTLFNWSTTVQGQHSLNDYQAGNYQVSFGDAYSVRGLREQSISGDSGFLATTQFGPIFQFDNKYVRSVNPYVGLDYAVANFKKHLDQAGGNIQSSSTHSAAAGLGLSLSGNNWRASAYAATPFAYDLGTEKVNKVDQKIKPSKLQVYFNLSTNF